MWSDAFLFVLSFVGSRHDAGAALVFKPIAVASNLNDGRVVQDPIEHDSGAQRRPLFLAAFDRMGLCLTLYQWCWPLLIAWMFSFFIAMVSFEKLNSH